MGEPAHGAAGRTRQGAVDRIGIDGRNRSAIALCETAAWEKVPVGDEHSGDDEHRRTPRFNLFLAATIEAGRTHAPVRIRNLSETGAMLEGAAFPPLGATLTLRRQEMEVVGEVVWTRPPRCGMRFRDCVTVAEWISGKRARPAFGQARVDAIQAAVRSGEAMAEAPAPHAEADRRKTSLDEALARELAHVQGLFKAISEELIGDPAVVERHLRLLQNFDIGDQILGHLTTIVAAPDREAAIRAVGMEELRIRLLRKTNSGS